MFQIQPLNAFDNLYGLPDDALKAQGILPEIADHAPGFPCRVSLRYAQPGERVLLLNYQHQPADTPFRAAHAIYVIDGAEPIALEPGALPPVFRQGRTLSVRAFGNDGMMRAADLCTEETCAATFNDLLGRDGVDYLQIHYAKYGCYAARAIKA